MNKLSLTGKRDFALTTDALAFMQSSYAPFEELVKLGGDNYILSGCVVTGSSVSSGWLVLKGKLLPFSGGTIQTNVRIVETTETITVDIGSREQTTYHAEFGTSADSSKNVAWTSIKRIPTLTNVYSKSEVFSRTDLELSWIKLTIPPQSSYTATSNLYVAKRRDGQAVFKGYIQVTKIGVLNEVFYINVPESFMPISTIYFNASKEKTDGAGPIEQVPIRVGAKDSIYEGVIAIFAEYISEASQYIGFDGLTYFL